jgi:hypothetical protein
MAEVKVNLGDGWLNMSIVHPFEGKEGRALAIVRITKQRQGGRLAKHQRVHLSRNGSEIVGQDEVWNESGWTTGESGIIQAAGISVTPGENLFEARDHLTGIKVSKSIVIPIEKKKSPTERKFDRTKLAREQKEEERKTKEEEKRTEEVSKPKPPTFKAPVTLNVSLVGKRGQQILIISVADADHKLVPNFRGTVLDGGNVASFKTNEAGTAEYRTFFTERSRLFEVIGGNDSHHDKWRSRLLGPKTPPSSKQLTLPAPTERRK